MKGAIGRSFAVLLCAAPVPAAAELTAEEMVEQSKAVFGSPDCGRPRNSGEIVVCGRAEPRARETLPEVAAPELLLPPAEIGLFGDVRARIQAEQPGRSDGLPDRRIKATVRLPF
nr:hypothetical protein [Sphingomonas laterariae]